MNLEYLLNLHQSYSNHFYATLVILIAYVAARRHTKPRIKKSIDDSNLDSDSLKKASNSINFILTIIFIILICIVWGFSFRGFLVISTGILTLTGVALFASWSILSNITAFFILLAHQSFKKGNFLRIIDADNYIEGYISDIGLLNTKLISENKEIIIYPNNLLISRPIIVNPDTKFNTIGKTVDIINNDKKSKPDNR